MQNGVQMDPTTVKYLFFQVYFYFFMIPHKVSRLFMSRTFKSGSLSVVGKGEVAIILGDRSPKHVEVQFSDFCKTVPCNHHHDELTFRIIKKEHKFSLIIEWEVADTRTIRWSLYN
jgi:hypothetical protein